MARLPFYSSYLHGLALIGAAALLLGLTGCETGKKTQYCILGTSLKPLSPEEQSAVDNLLARGDCACQNGQIAEALDLYRCVWEKYPDTPDAPEALYRAAHIRLARRQYDDAFELFDRILSSYPSYPKFNAVVREEFEMGNIMMDGARPYYFGTIPGFRSSQQAIDYFEGVVKKAPFTDYAPMSLMNIALIHEKNGQCVEAIDALDRLINTYPKSILLPDAYLKMGDLYASMVKGCEYDQGATKDAIRYYQDFIALFPRSEQIGRAEAGLAKMQCILAESKLFAGELYRNRLQDNEAALVFFNEAITAAPSSNAAQCARTEIAAIQRGDCPRGTPIDFLFPKPAHSQSLREYMEDSYLDARNEEIIDVLDEDGLMDLPGDVLQNATPLEEALCENDPLGEKVCVPEETPIDEALEDLPITLPADDNPENLPHNAAEKTPSAS